MKTNLLLLLSFCTYLATAQTLQIMSSDSLVRGNAYTSFDIEGHVKVKNVGTVDQTYLVKRIDKNYNNLTDNNAICWENCFLQSVSVAPQSIEIKVGEEFDGFAGHVYPDQDGVSASGPITYVFFAENDPTDSIVYTMHFSVDQTFSVKEEVKQDLVSVFPNPTNGKTKVSYKLQDFAANTFELYNVLGTKVYSKPLYNIKGEFEFDASDFAKGVYFYFLKSGDDVLESKKLVIQ